MQRSMFQKLSGTNFGRTACMLFAIPAIGLLCGFATVDRETISQPFTSTVLCGSDTITIDGTAKARLQIVQTPQGKLKGNFKLNLDGTGSSDSGGSYNLNEQENFSFNNLPDPTQGASQANFLLHGHLIGQGDAPNYAVLQHFHTTVDANGTVHAVIDNSEGDCTFVSGDIDITQPVPDLPLSIALLVPGLLGLAGVVRRFVRGRV